MEADLNGFVIDGLLIPQSVAMFFGESTIGKSPFLYQLGLSVSSGIKFLERESKPASVLYFDFENNSAQQARLIESISGFLGVEPPDGSRFAVRSQPLDHAKFYEIVKKVRPDIVIVDPVRTIYPDLEDHEKNPHVMNNLRRIVADNQLMTLIGVHHLKKSGEDYKQPPSLKVLSEVDRWFLQARGARGIVNYSDVRIGAEKDGEKLIVRSVMRVYGIQPKMKLSRAVGKGGYPIGYREDFSSAGFGGG